MTFPLTRPHLPHPEIKGRETTRLLLKLSLKYKQITINKYFFKCQCVKRRTLTGYTLQIKLEFENVALEEQTRLPGEKPLGTRTTTRPKYGASPGIEPGPYWWVASALTTAPSVLPQTKLKARKIAPSLGEPYTAHFLDPVYTCTFHFARNPC